jgi:hypothetical protein
MPAEMAYLLNCKERDLIAFKYARNFVELTVQKLALMISVKERPICRMEWYVIIKKTGKSSLYYRDN